MTKNINRIIGGRLAKSRGNQFENTLEASALRNKWVMVDIPDGCKQVSAIKLIRVKSPFDFVFLKEGLAVFCDAKTTKQSRFPLDKIKEHQKTILFDIYEQNFQAGYIVNFSEKNDTRFFNVYILSAAESSIKPELGLKIGDNFKVNFDLIFADKFVTHEVGMIYK